jgi:drug/metabolite transporter (DMT)-like permease
MTDAAPQPLKAALWMTGAIASFTSMAVAGREVSVELDTFETMMYRSFFGFFIVVIVLLALGRLGEINTDRLHLHGIRNLCHFTGQNLWFYAVAIIPFAQLFALEFTTPVWVALLAPLVLKEALTRTRLFAALLGFVGVLVVVRPGMTDVNAGVIAAAASAIGFAGSIMFTKLLTRTATVGCILFWLTVMQSVFGIVAAGWDGDIALPSSATLPFVLLIGAAGLLAHLCLTNALRVAPATVVVPMDFLRLPLIAVIGMMFYGEALDTYVFFGAGLIFAAVYVNLWAEARRVTVS